MSILFANNALSTLSGAISNVATSATLAPGSGVIFPNPTGGDYFLLTFTDAATGLLNEIVKVTARSGDVLTIVRAQEGTTALAWAAGDNASALITAGALAAFLQQTNARIGLTAPTTFYVASTGNDSTGNGTIGNPWLTIQHAINVIQASYDPKGFTVAIQLADSLTYAGATMAGGLVGGGILTIQGNAGSPANVRVAGPIICSTGSIMTVQNFQINSTGDAFLSQSGGQLRVGTGMIFGTVTGAHIYASQNGEIDVTASYSVVGSAAVHWQAISSGRISIAAGITITFTGAPTLTLFAGIVTASVLTVGALTFSGATTAGTKYSANLNSVISSGGQTFPGVTGGSVATGGQYT